MRPEVGRVSKMATPYVTDETGEWGSCGWHVGDVISSAKLFLPLTPSNSATRLPFAPGRSILGSIRSEVPPHLHPRLSVPLLRHAPSSRASLPSLWTACSPCRWAPPLSGLAFWRHAPCSKAPLFASAGSEPHGRCEARRFPLLRFPTCVIAESSPYGFSCAVSQELSWDCYLGGRLILNKVFRLGL